MGESIKGWPAEEGLDFGTENRIALLFAASWHFRSRALTQKLSNSKEADEDFPLALRRRLRLVNLELNDDDASQAVNQQMTVQCITERNPERRALLLRRCMVNKLPTLVVLDRSGLVSTEKEARTWAESNALPQWLLCLIGTTEADPFSGSQLSDQDAEKLSKEAVEAYNEGNFQQAALAYTEVLGHRPQDPDTNYNLGVLLHTLGLSRLAVRYIIRVVEQTPDDATAHSVLKSVLYPLEPGLVVEELRDLVKRQPTNKRALHALGSLTGQATSVDPDYVKQVFDGLSDVFEEKLVQHLGYRVPWDLYEEIKKLRPSGHYDIIDLGCGTGLCGSLFRPMARSLLGVDLSPKMIEKAKEGGFYDELRVQGTLLVPDAFDLETIEDINHTLTKQSNQSVDIILAADVWIYLGSLRPMFELCYKVLKPGGLLGFSVEAQTGQTEDFRILPSGRFSHSAKYIHDLIATHGFQEVVEQSIVVRKESTTALPGLLFIIRKI